MRFRLALMTLALFALLAAAGDAVAAKKKTADAAPVQVVSPKTVLLWGPSDGGDLAALARTTVEERIPKSLPLPGRHLKAGDWLGAARFRIGGSAESVPCSAPPIDVKLSDDVRSEIVAASRAAYARMDDLDYEGALKLYIDSQSRLACQETFSPRDAYWEVYFYAGIAAFYSNDALSARTYFRQAAAIAPDREWDPSYPTDPQATFLSAVQDVIARPRGKVYGDMRGTNYREVWLDGQQLDLTKAFETTVLPGKHLVQAVDDQGRWTSFVRDVKEGGTITFFSALGMEQMVLEGPDSVLRAIAVTTLSQKAREEGITEFYIVTLDPKGQTPPKVLRYVPDTDTWSRVEKAAITQVAGKEPELTPAEKQKRALLREADWRSSPAVGAKVARLQMCTDADLDDAGRCPNGHEQYATYFGGLVDIDIRLIKGLTLDIRFGALASDFTDGGTILAEVGLGVQYRFLQGVIQPWVGFGVDLFGASVKDTPFTPSRFLIYSALLPYWGVDFEAPDGFRISVEGGVAPWLGAGSDRVSWVMPHAMVAIGRFLP